MKTLGARLSTVAFTAHVERKPTNTNDTHRSTLQGLAKVDRPSTNAELRLDT